MLKWNVQTEQPSAWYILYAHTMAVGYKRTDGLNQYGWKAIITHKHLYLSRKPLYSIVTLIIYPLDKEVWTQDME